ncbi:MAG: carboxypeptidase-like regulatory domain-containing protein [Acidobacteriota bacterium]
MSDLRIIPAREGRSCVAVGLLLTTLVVIGSRQDVAAEDRSAAIAVDIRVQVVDAELQPLPGAVVEVFDAESDPEQPRRLAHTAVDGRGRARFEELPPGRYVVRANLTGFLDTEVGPLPLTAEELRATTVPELVLVLNALTVD